MNFKYKFIKKILIMNRLLKIMNKYIILIKRMFNFINNFLQIINLKIIF